MSTTQFPVYEVENWQKKKCDKSQDGSDLRSDGDSKRDNGGYQRRFCFLCLLRHEK